MLCNPALTDRDHSHFILRSEAKPPKYRTHFNKSLAGEIFINVKNKDTYTKKFHLSSNSLVYQSSSLIGR